LIAGGIEPGHQPRSYQIALDGSGVRPATPEGVRGGVLTPDEKFILAHAANQAWALYPLAGGAPAPLPGLLPDDIPLRYGADDHTLLVERRVSLQHPEIWRVDPASRQRTHLFTLSPQEAAGVGSEAVRSLSADGRAYVFSASVEIDILYTVSHLH